MTINELKQYAIAHGFDKVIFRNHTTNQGDFCIFLYNKQINNKRYCVGFDGYYNSVGNSDFCLENCINQAVEYINNYYKNINTI